VRDGARQSAEPDEQQTDHPAEAAPVDSHDPVELVKKGLGAEVVEEKTEGS
jgi:hypothetical protein